MEAHLGFTKSLMRANSQNSLEPLPSKPERSDAILDN